MFEIKHGPEHALNISVEMNHPNDNSERLNVGGEYGFKNTLFLRLGGKFGYDEESWAAGFGLKVPVVDNYSVRFDYAYSAWGRIEEASAGFSSQPHRFAIGLEW
jgi:hypothetical protein